MDQAVVCVVNKHDNAKLEAFVKRSSGSTQTEHSIQNFLKTKLAANAIPSKIIFVENYPLTPNAKVDRNALLKCRARRLVRKRLYHNRLNP